MTRTGPVDNTALNGDLDIAQNLTLLGEGASVSVVDGNGLVTNDRLLHILNPTAIVSISGVTLRNGRNTTVGGAIYNDGSLSLTDSVVSDSTAGDGGGIFNTDDGLMTLIGVTLDGNTADPSGPGAGLGGGLYNAGNATVTGDSVVHANLAFGGGGIGNVGVLSLSGSQVVANEVDQDGDGLWNSGLATLTASTVSNNVAKDDGDSLGGGIYTEGNIYPVGLVLTNVTIGGNVGQAYGGGLYVAAGSAARVSFSTISGNQAWEGGGGIRSSGTLDLTGSSLSTNAVIDGGGGGLYNTGTATLVSVTIHNNTVNDGGGGLANLSNGTLHLVNSTVSSNETNGHGGGLYNTTAVAYLYSSTFTLNVADNDQNSYGDGGGIYNASNGAVRPYNTVLAGNFDRTLALHPTHDCLGDLNSGGYNLLGINTACTGPAQGINGDIVGTALQPRLPGLAPLAVNGGPTLTHALLNGSVAIDVGNPAGCRNETAPPSYLTADQRGLSREVDGDNWNGSRCDIGAFEYSPELHRVFLPIIVR